MFCNTSKLHGIQIFVDINKVLSEYGHVYSFRSCVYGYFHTTAEMNTYNKDCLAYKTKIAKKIFADPWRRASQSESLSTVMLPSTGIRVQTHAACGRISRARAWNTSCYPTVCWILFHICSVYVSRGCVCLPYTQSVCFCVCACAWETQKSIFD